MSPRLVLYRAIASPPARAVMMLGDILGLDFEYRDVNLLKGEQFSEQYKKINPQSKVPTLQDGDFILPDSHAILKYLISRHGGAHRDQLYPREPRLRAAVDVGLFFHCGQFFKDFAAIAFPMLQGHIQAPTQQQIEALETSFGVVETLLRGRRFVAADRLTIADLSLGATATAGKIFYDIDHNRLPRVADWIERLEEKPYFETINAEGVAFMRKLVNRAQDKNKKNVK